MAKNHVVVVGAGAWGGWSAYHLLQMGCTVTLVDMLGPGHLHTGSGGKTRVIRMAYGGNTTYTDLVARSFDLWQSYEDNWNEQFYHETGSLWMFRGVSPAYATLSQPLMAERGYQLESLDLDEARARYPQIDFQNISSAYLEPKVGYLESARACEVVKEHFVEEGGTYIQQKVVSIEGQGRIRSIGLANGETLEGDQFVFACGPWMSKLFPALNDLIKVSRQEVYFFDAPADYLAPNLPIWIEFREGESMYYGIPDHFNQGFKVAYDQRTWPLDPDLDDRDVTPEILEHMQQVLAERFPAIDTTAPLTHRTCVYESSVDGDFIIDQAPGYGNGLILCGSSGHGFKMGPAIGEMIAEHLVKGDTLPPELALQRFQEKTKAKTQYEV